MSDADRHTRRIQQQFTRQADVYRDMEQTKDQLAVHEEEGRLRFRHNVAAYRLRVPA